MELKMALLYVYGFLTSMALIICTRRLAKLEKRQSKTRQLQSTSRLFQGFRSLVTRNQEEKRPDWQ